MGTFSSLTQSSHFLYRGGNGEVARVIMSVAVGPARAVARVLAEDDSTIPDDLHESVCATFKKLLLVPDEPDKPKVHCPFRRVKDCTDWILTSPRLAANQLTPFEHVVWEESINSPSTARLLESTSKNPQIAILYAYGIQIEPWHSSGSIAFHRDQPNKDAFIAVLDPGQNLPLAKSYSLNVAGEQYAIEECDRRIKRDSEVLLQEVVRPARLVSLPEFDVANPGGSLDNAADALAAAGVATS